MLENNKLDLTQVEVLSDFIDAETEAQRLQAKRVLSGDIGEKVADREKLFSKHSPFAEVFIKILNDNNNLLYSSELHAKIEKEIMY